MLGKHRYSFYRRLIEPQDQRGQGVMKSLSPTATEDLSLSRTHARTHTHIHTHTHIYIYIYIYTHTYIQTHRHIYINITQRIPFKLRFSKPWNENKNWNLPLLLGHTLYVHTFINVCYNYNAILMVF